MSAIHPDHRDPFIAGFRRRYRLSQITLAATAGLYLLAGLGALAVSFTLHSRVIGEMLGEAGFVPSFTAASLEGFKLGTIAVYGYLHRKTRPRPEASPFERIRPVLMVGLIRFFQLMVLTLSLTCTMAVVAQKFDRPDLPAVRAQDLADLQSHYQRRLADLATRQAQEKADLEKAQTTEQQLREAQYQPLIATEQEGLRVERRREGRTGRVMGGRYESHRQELGTYNDRLQASLAEHNRQVAAERGALSLRHGEAMQALTVWYEQEQDKIRHASYRGDHRVEHKTVAAVVAILNEITRFFGMAQVLAPSGFVALFALMLSAILELGIFLSLSALSQLAFPDDVLTFEHYMEGAEKKTSPSGFRPSGTSNGSAS
jgi:hypothetical protein